MNPPQAYMCSNIVKFKNKIKILKIGKKIKKKKLFMYLILVVLALHCCMCVL